MYVRIADLQAEKAREAKLIEEISNLAIAIANGVASEEDLNELLTRKLADIASVLRSDPERAKQEMQNRIDDFWIEPVQSPYELL